VRQKGNDGGSLFLVQDGAFDPSSVLEERASTKGSYDLIIPFLVQDGVLNDAELNEFQVQCFSAPLQPEELAGVRKVVSQKMPQVGVPSIMCLPKKAL
jgi:hypothetical protein